VTPPERRLSTASGDVEHAFQRALLLAIALEFELR